MHFIAITDHNQLTGPPETGVVDGLLVLPGSEFSGSIPRGVGGACHLHVNGIGVDRALAPAATYSDIVAGLRDGVAQARAAGGLAMINHPNWHWAFDHRAMLAVEGWHGFELWNGSRTCNNDGDAEHPATEVMWDAMLTAGRRCLGLATDDAHHLSRQKLFNDAAFSGWIGVWAEALETQAILTAIRAGHFYAANGPRLERLELAADRIAISLQPWDQTTHTIELIGPGGRVLERCEGHTATWTPPPDAAYVRIRVRNTQLGRLWTQPMFRGDRELVLGA